MNAKRMAQMAQRIAEDAADEPLVQSDQAVDLIIAGVQGLAEWLPKIDATTPEQKAAKAKAIDLVETALAPYAAELAKAFDAFDTDDEEE